MKGNRVYCGQRENTECGSESTFIVNPCLFVNEFQRIKKSVCVCKFT